MCFAFLRVHGAHESEGDLYGFFHNVAQLPGDLHFAFAFGQFCLDEEDGAACAGPGKPGHDAGDLPAEPPFGVDPAPAQVIGKIASCYGERPHGYSAIFGF